MGLSFTQDYNDEVPDDLASILDEAQAQLRAEGKLDDDLPPLKTVVEPEDLSDESGRQEYDPDFSYEKDPDPQWDKSSLADKIIPDNPSAPPKIKIATRKDINAKVTLMLAGLGSVWKHYDEPCGSVFLHCVPDTEEEDGVSAGIASAVTDVVCDSPDLIKWFTSSGKYMKWLNLAMAVQPVVAVAVSHHVMPAVSRLMNKNNPDGSERPHPQQPPFDPHRAHSQWDMYRAG